MSQTELSKLWGKFDGTSGAKQPLIAHLTDVAAVFEQISKGKLFRHRFQRLTGSPMSEALHERLCVLALWHDFGKISPRFQIKYREFRGKTDKKSSVNHIKAAFNLMQQYKTSLWRPLLETMHFWETAKKKMSSHILCLTKRVQTLYNKYGSVTRGCTQYIDVKIQIPARSPLHS